MTPVYLRGNRESCQYASRKNGIWIVHGDIWITHGGTKKPSVFQYILRCKQ